MVDHILHQLAAVQHYPGPLDYTLQTRRELHRSDLLTTYRGNPTCMLHDKIAKKLSWGNLQDVSYKLPHDNFYRGSSKKEPVWIQG